MRGIFNIDGPIFSFLSKMADLMWLNLLFVVCCLPIVTIGASTTAMHYVCLKIARDEDCYIAKSFFKSFKQNFKQSTIVWLLLMVIGAVLLIDLKLLAGDISYEAVFNNRAVNTVVLTAIIICFILTLLMFVYAFAMLAQFDNTIKNTLKNSLILGLKHLPMTILLFAILLAPYLFLWFEPKYLIVLVILFALQSFVSAKIYVRIFDKYIPEKEEVVETVNEEDIDYSILGARPIEDSVEKEAENSIEKDSAEDSSEKETEESVKEEQ